MKIAYDISILEDEQLTGVEKLAFNLFEKMRELGKEHQHILICRKQPKCIKDLPDNCSLVITGPKKLWRWFELRKVLKRQKVDAFVSGVTNLTIPIWGLKMYPTVMECQWLHETGEKKVMKYKWLTWLAAFMAKRVITISKFSAKDIISDLPFNRKVEVIYPSFDKGVVKKCERSRNEILKELNIDDGDYHLFVSSIRPKKNIDLLIDCFAKLPSEKLILAGKVFYPEFPEKVKKRGLKNIYFLGYTDDQTVSDLYEHAKAFLYISKHEGFGLPILEAFSHKCPVIVTRNGSIPEVAGDAGEYVSGDSVDELVECIKGFKKKETFESMSAEILTQFTWEKSARKFLNLLEEDYESEKKYRNS